MLRPHGAYMDVTTDAKYESIQNTAFPTGNEVTNAEGTYWQMGWANGYSTSLKN